MKNSFRAILLTAPLFLITTAMAQGVAQPSHEKDSVAGFHGTTDTLTDSIRAIEQSTGGVVTEIRYSEENGLPGYHAAVAKGGQIEFIHIQEHYGKVVQIDASSGPTWMLKWRGRSDVHFAEKAKVSLSTAIHTAELSKNGAPALAAGIATSASNPTANVQAYNVLLDVDGSTRRVAVDDSSGEVIADPSALTDF